MSCSLRLAFSGAGTNACYVIPFLDKITTLLFLHKSLRTAYSKAARSASMLAVSTDL